MKNILCFVFFWCALLIINSVADEFSYAEYAVFPQFAANDSIQTVASYNAPSTDMSFAIALFANFSRERPDYTNQPLLYRIETSTSPGVSFIITKVDVLPEKEERSASYEDRIYNMNSKIIQICNLTACECRYDKIYTIPTDAPLAGFIAYDMSRLPQAYYYTSQKQEQGASCSPLSLMLNTSCVVFFRTNEYFQVCVSHFLEDMPSCNVGSTAYNGKRFCVAGMTSGQYKTSHPLFPFVNIDDSNSQFSSAEMIAPFLF